MSATPRRPARSRPPLRGRAAAARPCAQPLRSVFGERYCPPLRRPPRHPLAPPRRFTMPEVVATGPEPTPQDGNMPGCSRAVAAVIGLVLLLLLLWLLLGP
jgi:hypothetical protein